MDKQLRGILIGSCALGFMSLEQNFGIYLTFIFLQSFYVFYTEEHCTRQVQAALPCEWLLLNQTHYL